MKGNDEFPNKKQKLKDILFATVDDQRSTESALKLISDLKSEVQTAGHYSEYHAGYLNEIRIAIAEAVETSKINGNYHGSADSVSLQLNELTSQTVLKLIKQEYGRGYISQTTCWIILDCFLSERTAAVAGN